MPQQVRLVLYLHGFSGVTSCVAITSGGTLSLLVFESSRSGMPPALVPDKSSSVGKVPPYFIQHKRDQVQAFDKNVQLDPFTAKQFLECLDVRDKLIPSEIPHSPQNLSIDGFCSLANGIAQSIKETREHYLLCIYLFLTIHDFH